MKKTVKASENNNGFTLVEMIVVLVMLAILAAILIPAFIGYIDKANEKAAIAEARGVFLAAQTTISEFYGSNQAFFIDAFSRDSVAKCTNYPFCDTNSNTKLPNKISVCRVSNYMLSRVQKNDNSIYSTDKYNNDKYKIDREVSQQVLLYLESEGVEQLVKGVKADTSDCVYSFKGVICNNQGAYASPPYVNAYTDCNFGIAIFYLSNGKVWFIEICSGDYLVRYGIDTENNNEHIYYCEKITSTTRFYV